MKNLIDAIKTFLEAAIGSSLSAEIVYKGFNNVPEQPSPDKFPYIALDDGGERVENGGVGESTQTRIYTVMIEYGVLLKDPEKILDDVLTVSDEIKALLEDEDNRQKNGHVWGISIVPFEAEYGDSSFKFAGRRIAVDYYELEDTYFDY